MTSGPRRCTDPALPADHNSGQVWWGNLNRFSGPNPGQLRWRSSNLRCEPFLIIFFLASGALQTGKLQLLKRQSLFEKIAFVKQKNLIVFFETWSCCSLGVVSDWTDLAVDVEATFMSNRLGSAPISFPANLTSNLSGKVWATKVTKAHARSFAHLFLLLRALWPDWAIYWSLDNFLRPLATINLPKSPTHS